MKTSLFLISILVLLTVNCFAQDSIVDYLLKSKIDFNTASKIISNKVIDEADIVFIGESHGYNANHKIANRFIEEYKEATDFTYLLAEMDWSYAQELNKNILSEDTSAIKAMLADSKATFAWCQESYQFYKNIITLNKNYDTKIKYLGVDIPSGNFTCTAKHLHNILAKYKQQDTLINNLDGKNNISNTELIYIKQLYNKAEDKAFNTEDLFYYKYLLNNIINVHLTRKDNGFNWDKIRDSCIFENYKALEAHLHLKNQKMIGVWGYAHTFQQEVDSIKWFASRLKKDLNKEIYTYNIFYFDSRSMMPEQFIPGTFKVFKSKKKLYYNSKLQNSDYWVNDSWLVGTKLSLSVFKEATAKNTITCFNLEKENSPFCTNPLLLKPYNYGFNTSDIMQSVIVVRNSEPTRPFGENKK